MKVCSSFFRTTGWRSLFERYQIIKLIACPSRLKHDACRREDFGHIEDKDLTFFERLLDKTQIITDENELEAFNTDWMNSYKGASKLLLKPRTNDEISAILKHCNKKRLAICPQGGNTGLVGGSVPVFDEIIVSTALMNKIIGFNELLGVLKCEAGCILEQLNNYVSDKGHIMPLDLGAKGSCHIGGNVATNAGGLRYIRYGSLRGNVLGLEMVLPNGEILDGLNCMKKDNTGYDIKQLFIGSEGTLGLITKVAIACPIKPNSKAVAYIGCPSFDKVLNVYLEAQNKLSEILSSVEYMDRACVGLTKNHLKLNPILSDHPFYMIIEVSGSDSVHDEEKLHKFIEHIYARNDVADAVIATEPSRIQKIWELRERITEALKHDGHVYKYDISIPQIDFHNMVLSMQKRLSGLIRSCVGYGHLGDSNLHLNVTSKAYSDEVIHLIEPFLFEEVQRLGGSISAEHGIGRAKRNYLHYSKPNSSIKMMKQIKKIFDPHGIMNPYKMFED